MGLTKKIEERTLKGREKSNVFGLQRTEYFPDDVKMAVRWKANQGGAGLLLTFDFIRHEVILFQSLLRVLYN